MSDARPDASARYLDLLKKALTYSLWPQPLVHSEFHDGKRPAWKLALYKAVRRVVRRWDLHLMQPRLLDPNERSDGLLLDEDIHAHTLIGLKRLDNLQHCLETLIREKIPGDLVETGVWRGGACIFMRAVLAVHGVADRRVFVADSFQGLPPPDEARWPADRGDAYHRMAVFRVSQAEVEENFRNYGLLDAQVVFLPGWFRDTLPRAPIERLALLRLDGDMYGSTMEALEALYPKLSPGGYCIVDDYALPGCRQAVDEYRARNSIAAPLIDIDWTGRYWRKAAA